MKKTKYILLIPIIIIIFGAIGFFLIKKTSNNINRNDINFAGENLPLSGQYAVNEEKFEREVAVIKLNLPQLRIILERRSMYIPYIEKKLKEKNLPQDLKYIPIIESALRTDAKSPAGALGIRQFMEGTAKQYGLKVDKLIDERLNFEKSTDAALAYLTVLYKKFGNRSLVAAAYNRGENGLSQDMQRQKTKNYYDLWLNSETSRYVYRILATKYVMEKSSLFDISLFGKQHKTPETYEVQVGEIKNLVDRSLENKHTYLTLKELNPRILGNSLPKGKWTITLYSK